LATAVRPGDSFSPVTRGSLITWCAAYALFGVYAAANTSGFLFIDHANLMFHEAGHFFFAWAGYYTQILGGTLGQLLVPLVCTAVFFHRRETTAVAFGAFWFFQNFLYVATYMADARTSALPLVGSDESDWTILFSHWGVLQQDRAIATWMRGIGWIGMLGSVTWLVWMGVRIPGHRAPEN
jgi:hypothetical protein